MESGGVICYSWFDYICCWGKLIEKLGMDDQVADFIKQTDNVDVGFVSLTVKDRRNFAKEQVIETVKKYQYIYL